MGQLVRGVAYVLCFALTASACSLLPFADEPTAATADAMRWLTAEQCSELRPARDSAIATESLPLDGWPGDPGDDWGAVVAEVTSAEVDPDDGYLAVVADWGEIAHLRVPIHPSEDPEGGPIEIRFGQLGEEDRTRWCDESHQVMIEPLPAASAGEGVRAQLEELTVQIDAAAVAAGTSVDELIRLEVEQVPSDLVPLAVVAHLVQDDGIAALLDDLPPAERDLADRVMAHARSGADADPDPEVLAELAAPTPAASRTPLSTPRAQLTSLSAAGANPSRHAGPDPSPRALTVAADGSARCIPTTFEELSTLLGRQMSGSTMLGGGTELTIDLAMAVGGLPIISRWALPTVLTAWATKATSEYLANMLPSAWEASSLTYAPETLWEDDVEGGEVEAFEMRMSSTGWDTGPIIAELGMIVADMGISAGLRRFLRPSPRMGQPDVVEFWGEPVWVGRGQEIARERIEVMSEFFSWTITNVATQVAGEDAAAGRLQLDPRCWEAVTTSPDLYEPLFLTYSDAIEKGSASEYYRAADRGIGTIDAMVDLPIGEHILGPVSARSREAKARFRTNDEVEVRPIEIVWSPERQVVQPGQVVTLGLTVNNAHDTRVRLTDSLGQLDTEMDARVGASLTYQVPQGWDGTPIQITATSLSSTGLRQPSHPAYRGEVARSAWLLGEDDPALYLEPLTTCLDEGQTVGFQAFDEPLGGDEVPVSWVADGGSIQGDGTFTAPSEAGEVTVTATSLEDPSLTASLTLTVGRCDQCGWDLTIDGLLGDDPAAQLSGSTMTLSPVEWGTGAFSQLTLEVDGTDETIRFSNVDRQPSTASDRSMHVIDHPFEVVTRYRWAYGDDDVPNTLQGIWHDRADGDSRPDPIVGWHVDAAQARLQHELVTATSIDAPTLDGEVPTILLRGEISGPVVVGETITGTVDGNAPANTAGVAGEPIYGTVSLTFEGTFQAPIHGSTYPDPDPVGAWCGDS